MIFGASQDVSGLPESEAQMQTQSLMQQAWAAFADDPKKGLKKGLGWPEYDVKKETLILLAHNNTPTASFVKPSVYDGACSVYLSGYMGI